MKRTYKHKLSNGRGIRSLKGEFTQAQVFKLRENGLYTREREEIITMRDVGDVMDKRSQRDHKILETLTPMSRTGEFVFYPRGFETDLTKPIGKRLFWMEKESDSNKKETGRILEVIINIPDVPVIFKRGIDHGPFYYEKEFWPKGTEMSLQKVAGMGVIPIEKLELKMVAEDSNFVLYEVSVSSDFDPATDVKVKDVFRPRGWTNHMDEDGYSLQGGGRFTHEDVINDRVRGRRPRLISLREANEFLLPEQLSEELQANLAKRGIKLEDMGFGASVAESFLDGMGFVDHEMTWLHVYANLEWSFYGGVTAIVSKFSLTDYKISYRSGTLIVDGFPEQLEEAERRLGKRTRLGKGTKLT